MSKKIFLGLVLIFLGISRCASYAGDINWQDKMDDTPFGVLEFLHWNDTWNNFKYPDETSLAKAVSLMKDAGVSWVRVDFLWQDIEPKEGEFDFEKYDKIVDLLTLSGINVLGIFGYSAEWASSCGQWNSLPRDNKLLINYALEVIRRYKGRVKYWELWNEPDSSVYWKDQDGLKNYCQLLKEFYPQAKKADPECRILNGGLAIANSSVNRLYDNGAAGYFDILNIHIFVNPLNTKAIKTALAYPRLAYKIMKRNGDGNKKIWVTEIGCPGVRPGIDTADWWLGKNPREKQQAEWVKEVFTQLIKAGAVEKVFWAFFRDCKGHWGNGTDYFGLVRWDFSRKPALGVYKECVKHWKEG